MEKEDLKKVLELLDAQHSFVVKGKNGIYRISKFRDLSDSANPRRRANVGCMACWDTSLWNRSVPPGDRQPKENPEAFLTKLLDRKEDVPDGLDRKLSMLEDAGYSIFPLYLCAYQEPQICLSCPQYPLIGFLYAKRNGQSKESVDAALTEELELYNRYLRHEVFVIVIYQFSPSKEKPDPLVGFRNDYRQIALCPGLFYPEEMADFVVKTLGEVESYRKGEYK